MSDYEVPETLSGGYGSMRSGKHIYKSAQLRRSGNGSYNCNSRGFGQLSAPSNALTPLLGLVLVVLSVNFALSVYIVIAIESKQAAFSGVDRCRGGQMSDQVVEKLEHIQTSISTMMNALSYTIPQVLSNNKLLIVNKLHSMASEIRSILSSHNIDFNVKWNTNKTVTFKSSRTSTNNFVPTRRPHVTDTGYDTRQVTIIPKMPRTKANDIPMQHPVTGGKKQWDLQTSGATTDGWDDYGVTLLEDLANTNPIM